MAVLLDVNVLIALLEPAHIYHDMAHDWFIGCGGEHWATCPITQNGFIRIVSQQAYAYPLGAPAAIETLREFTEQPGHEFWPDSISLLDSSICEAARLTSARRVTDSYLLALATRKGGRLATFDQRLATDAVIGGRETVMVLGRTSQG